MDVVNMMFCVAFNKIPHARLLHRVKAHGIERELANRIQNWLNDRTQRVAVVGWFSLCKLVVHHKIGAGTFAACDIY